MDIYQTNVIKEKEELDLKIKNLQKFIETNSIFETLIENEKKDLVQQLNTMIHYSVLLQNRINRF